MRDIGKNIKAARIRKNLTQDELAEKLYVTRQTVSNYETGHSRPDVEILISISNVLGIELEELLYGGQSSEDKKKRLKAFIIAAGIALAVWTASLTFLPYFAKLAMTRYIMQPVFLVKGVVFPALYFIVGWLVLLGCEIFLGARPPKFLSNLYTRIAYFVILGVCVSMLLPIAVLLVISIITLINNTHPSSWSSDSIPIIGNLSAGFYLYVCSNSYLAIFFGAGLWLVSGRKERE